MFTKEILEEIKWNQLKEDGITKSDVDLVDLSIAFSPVIPCNGDISCDVIETIGGKYLLVGHPIFTDAIDAESLKVMRYRFLSNRVNPIFFNPRH